MKNSPKAGIGLVKKRYPKKDPSKTKAKKIKSKKYPSLNRGPKR